MVREILRLVAVEAVRSSGGGGGGEQETKQPTTSAQKDVEQQRPFEADEIGLFTQPVNGRVLPTTWLMVGDRWMNWVGGRSCADGERCARR
jgi:hypothetical protein